jgi:hypothetical protein
VLSVCRLNPVFSRRCTFSLEILFIPGCLDLVEWIRHQESIKGIGIHVDGHQEHSQLTVYRALLEERNPHHLFSLWNVVSGGTSLTTIYVVPAFSRPWSAKPIWDSLLRMEYPGHIWRLKLYLTCLSDEDALRSVLASIAQYFPQVCYLEFVVQDRNIHLVRVFSPFQPDVTISNLGICPCMHRILTECHRLCP